MPTVKRGKLDKELRVKLLGSPAAFVDNEPVTGFVSTKAQALLFYLAATGAPHRRDALASLLWCDVPDVAARKNLRDVLSNLRRLIGPFLVITRQEVGLNPDAPVFIDSQVLLGTMSAVRDMGATEPAPANALQPLAEIADPHIGEFLDGFHAPDAPLFEEWMLAERAHLQWELGNALERLTEYSLAFGDYAGAEAYARRQLELDSYREKAHRQLMTILALSDRRAEAVAHYEGLADLLQRELGLDPADKTQELVAQIQAGKPIPVTFDEISLAPTHNLPLPQTPFIGRERELADITGLLTGESGCRLLTLVGPGGIGKTRLGIEAAGRLLETFRHGVFFISLAPVRETSFIVPAIGKALSFRFQGAREPKEQLLDYLQSRQTLLLVDNFEHLLSDVDLLSEILGSAPGVKILATSRERLNLREEWVYEVRGMPYPSEFDPKQMEREPSLQEYSAIRLFIQYARQADASRPVPADELPHVVHLCQLLDGLPLGLELAASWVRSMTVQEITAEVASNLDFLSTTLRNVPERQRSLRAIFEQTWQRLSRDEQSVMANLSVFRGGCRQEAAEKVAGATLIALDSLVEKALLHRSQDGRYDMHEMIRQFASEQLRQHITAYESTLDRHSAYYAAFLQRLEDDTVGWNMLNTLKIIGEEIDNISAALDWAVTRKDAAVFEQAAESLVQYWPYPSLERQGEFIIEQAVTALTGSAERGIDVHYPRLSPKLRPLVGFLIAMQGFLVARMGEPGAAQPLLEQGVALQEPSTSRHKRRLAKSKYHLGWTLCSQGNFQKAMSELREALALFSDVQYPHGMAWCLVHLGRVSYQSGQIEEANRFFVKSRELSDKYGFFEIGGYSLLLQAVTTIEQGNYSEAMELLNRSLILYRDVGTYMDLAAPIRERGRLYLLLGRFGCAEEEIDKGMALYQKHGNAWTYEVNLTTVADLNRLQGNYEKAEQLYTRGLAAAREVNNQRLSALFLSDLGTLAFDQGAYAKAEKLQREALDIGRNLHNGPLMASVLRYLGQATMALGKDAYRRYYLESLQLAETHRLAPVALDVIMGIAQIYAQNGKDLEAIAMLTMVIGHEASTHETKTNASNTLEIISADVDEKLIAEAQSRGRERELWEVTRKLLSNGPLSVDPEEEPIR